MILIKEAGIQSTIQDGGRFGYQHIGVSPCGAMDRTSFEMSNYLVGNGTDQACIETAYGGLVIEFLEPVEIAITGANFKPSINNHPVPMNETLYPIAGDILSLGNPQTGIYGYIAFAGGLGIEPIFDSYSTDLKSGIGGLHGKKLTCGQKIKCNKASKVCLPKRIAPKDLLTPIGLGSIGVLEGPEIHHFSPPSIQKFFSEPFVLDATSNRMGYRLQGDPIQAVGSHDIVSSGLTRGTIQVTAKGKLIVMMADHQSTGGYSRIANVTSQSLPQLAQMRPGDEVTFFRVDLLEAHQQIHHRQRAVEAWLLTYKDLPATEPLKTQHFNIRVNNKEFSVRGHAIK